MLPAPPQISVHELARRAVLAKGTSSWNAVIVPGERVHEQARAMQDAVDAEGLTPVEAQVTAQLESAPEAAQQTARAALFLIADDAVDEHTWRLLDHRRSGLRHRGVTVLVLTPSAAASFERSAPHISSLLSGRIWCARLFEAEQLLARGRVQEARLAAGGGAGSLSRALQPPASELRPASGKGLFARNLAWLRLHRDEHVGKWVALYNGELVDSDASRVALQKRLGEHPNLEDTLFVQVDAE